MAVNLSVVADHALQIAPPEAFTKARRKDRSLTLVSPSLSAGTLLA